MKLSKSEVKQSYSSLIEFLSDVKTVNELVRNNPKFKMANWPHDLQSIFTAPRIGEISPEVILHYINPNDPSFYIRDSNSSSYLRAFYVGKFSAACGKLLFSSKSESVFNSAIKRLHESNLTTKIGFESLSNETITTISRALTERAKNSDNSAGELCKFEEGNREYRLGVQDMKFIYNKPNDVDPNNIRYIETTLHLSRTNSNALLKNFGYSSFPRQSIGHVFDTCSTRKQIVKAIRKDLLQNIMRFNSKLSGKYSL